MARLRWMLPGLAAGAVVLVAVGTVIGLGDRDRDRDPAPVGAAPTTPSVLPPPRTEPADLLVRDGDRVVVSGQVLALPGRPVRMCAPVAVAGPGYAPGHEPLPEYCDLGVTVRGLDLAAVTDRKLDRGVVTGQARVEGTYRAGVVTVDRQAAPDPTPQARTSLPERPPCPPPAGGWQVGQTDIDALTRYLAAHPDQYVDPWVTYPDGYPKSDDGSTPEATSTVPVVGTVLDPAVAEAALRKIHPGSLCVVRVRHPASTLKRITDLIVGDSEGWPAHGVHQVGPDGITGTVDVELVVLDPAAKRWLNQVDDRTGTVTPHPWVRPLRPR